MLKKVERSASSWLCGGCWEKPRAKELNPPVKGIDGHGARTKLDMDVMKSVGVENGETCILVCWERALPTEMS